MLVQFKYPKTFDGIFDNIFRTDVLPNFIPYPAVDVIETKEGTSIVAELPGVKKEDLKLKFENNVLTISGERKPYQTSEDARVLLNELRVCNFNRSLEISHDVDIDKISAEITDGILQIDLPKSENVKPKEIQIK